MPENANAETIYYNSLFRHGVDDKRRVQIPAKWRPSNADVELTLILWPQGGKPDVNIMVLPPQEMKALWEQIRTMPLADARANTLRRLIGSKSASAPVDKAGRICLPESMAKAAGIGSEAVLVGLVDYFEIWSPERHALVSAADEALSSQAFELIGKR
jgi:MraZ protein